MKTMLSQFAVRDRSRGPRGRSEGGQAAFEFLLVLPLFIFLILILVDFGILMYGYVSVANAAREGARYAAVNCGIDAPCSQTLVQDRTRDTSSGFVTSAQVTVRWAGVTRGSDVSVKALRPHTFLFIPQILGVPKAVDVLSCAHMRLERNEGGAGLPAGSAC